MDAQNHLAQKLAGRGIDPVRVLDDEQHRRALRCEEQTINKRSDNEFLALLGRKVGRLESITEVQREELGIDRSDIGRVFPVVRSTGVHSFSARAG